MAFPHWEPAQLITASKLDAGTYAKFETIAALVAEDTSLFGTYKSAIVKDRYEYIFDPLSTADASGIYILEPTTGGGRWHLQNSIGDLAIVYLAEMIPEYLPSVSATLNFGSISAGAYSELTITVDGAVPDQDCLFVGPPSAIEAGLDISYYVSDYDEVTIRLHNGTGSGIDPASATWRVWVVKNNFIGTPTRLAFDIYQLLSAEGYSGSTLNTELSDDFAEADFRTLLSNTNLRRQLLADASVKSIIQASAIADQIMEDYEGAGY